MFVDTKLIEKAQCLFGTVLVVYAEDRDFTLRRQFVQQRHLYPARHAPGRPDVHDTHLPFEVGGRQTVGSSLYRRQVELRHRLANKWGRKSVVAIEQAPIKTCADEGEDRNWQHGDKPTLTAIGLDRAHKSPLSLTETSAWNLRCRSGQVLLM